MKTIILWRHKRARRADYQIGGGVALGLRTQARHEGSLNFSNAKGTNPSYPTELSGIHCRIGA
jgi:hypothetical protein